MTTGFNTAATGMVWAQKAIDVTANNISNLNTDGYKADKASFADLLYTQVKEPAADPNLKVGHGSKLGKTDTLFAASAPEETNRAQDYALKDARNFFALRTADGRTVYTRDGRFSLSKYSDGNFHLVSGAGDEVLDPSGRPIVVTDGNKAQNVGVFTFTKLDGLEKAGKNAYTATSRSGAATVVSNAEVLQGYLENSGSDLSTEISNMIVQERAYDLDAKLVTMTDEVMQTVNGLR